MLHLPTTMAYHLLRRSMLCLVVLGACKMGEPNPVFAPLQTDHTAYVLGAGVWFAAMRVTYTNTRSDTVYFRLACDVGPAPGRAAERLDASGREVFVEQTICGGVPLSPPPAIAVPPGATFVDTASLHVSMWVSSDSVRSQAAVTGRFQLAYDLCIVPIAATATTRCDHLPLAQRVTNAFDVVAPAP